MHSTSAFPQISFFLHNLLCRHDLGRKIFKYTLKIVLGDTVDWSRNRKDDLDSFILFIVAVFIFNGIRYTDEWYLRTIRYKNCSRVEFGVAVIVRNALVVTYPVRSCNLSSQFVFNNDLSTLIDL